MAESTARDAEAAHRHVMLTELFGMHPRAIVDALVVHANEHLYLLGAKLEEQVRALLPADQAERDAEQGVHAITTLLENVIDYIMDAFELFCMDSVFVITPAQSRRMTLSHHRGLDLRGETQERIPDAEHALRRRIASAEQAAHVRLQRAEAVRSAYAFFGVEAKRALGDASPVDAAHKVTLAVPKVLAALERLRAERPLAHALLPAPDAEHPVDQRAWEKGRDEYLNWEAHRIIASMRAHSS